MKARFAIRLLWFVGTAEALLGGAAVMAQSAPGGAAAGSDPANPHPSAAFLGTANCLSCHEDVNKSYVESPHGHATDPRTPVSDPL